MKRDARPFSLTMLLLIGAATAAAGCLVPPAGSAGSAAMKECGPDGVIDDFEDNDNQTKVADGRGGYWYTYVDKEGSTVWPEPGDAGGTFTPVEGGYNSKYAANVKGKITNANVVFGALGMNLTDPRGLYDASKYEGVTFWAKRGSASTPKVRVKMPDVNTDPEGGVCDACFNDYGVDLNLSEQWSRYVIPFRDMRQQPDWGSPRKPHLDRSKIFAIQWQTQAKGADYDFLIDSISFICKN